MKAKLAVANLPEIELIVAMVVLLDDQGISCRRANRSRNGDSHSFLSDIFKLKKFDRFPRL